MGTKKQDKKKEKMAGINPVMSVLNVSGLSCTVKKAKILDFFLRSALYTYRKHNLD